MSKKDDRIRELEAEVARLRLRPAGPTFYPNPYWSVVPPYLPYHPLGGHYVMATNHTQQLWNRP